MPAIPLTALAHPDYDKLFLLSLLASPTADVSDEAPRSLSPILSALPMQMYLSSFGRSLRERQLALEQSNFTSPTGGGGRFVLTIKDGVVGAEWPWGARTEMEKEKGETVVGLVQAVEDSSAQDGGML